MQPNKWQKREKGNRELFQFLYRICKGKKRNSASCIRTHKSNKKKKNQKNKIFLNLCNYITFHGIRDIKRLMSLLFFFFLSQTFHQMPKLQCLLQPLIMHLQLHLYPCLFLQSLTLPQSQGTQNRGKKIKHSNDTL